MTITITKKITISENHPCLAGHFPERPIVPGVVLLDWVRKLLTEHDSRIQIATIAQVKFHSPLSPEQPFTILLEKINAEEFRFECQTDTAKLASGKLGILINND